MTEHFDEIGFETFTEVCSCRNIRCEANFQRNVGGNKWLQKRTFPGRVVKERKQRKEGWGGSRGVSVCVLMTLQKPEEAAGEESPCSQTNDLFLCSRRRGKKVRRRERGRDLRGDTRWRGVRVRAIKTYLG